MSDDTVSRDAGEPNVAPSPRAPRAERSGGPERSIAPYLVGVAALICALAFWRIQVATEEREVLSLTRGVAAGVRADLTGQLRALEESLRFLAVRASRDDEAELRAWGVEARFVMERFPGLLWIEWIGPGVGPGRRITRPDLAESFVGEADPPARRSAADSGVFVSDPFQVGEQRWAFRIDVPLDVESTVLSATIGLEDFVDRALTDEARRNYVVVTAPPQIAYQSREPTVGTPVVGRPLFGSDTESAWILGVSLSVRAAESVRSALPVVALALGLVIAALLALITRSLGRERRRAADLAVLNAELDDRVRDRTRELATANRRLAEENAERRVAQEHLSRVNESLSQFDGFISHELRRPLAAIGAWLELLTRSPAVIESEKATRHASKALAEVHRMGRLIEKELEFSRATHGGEPTRPVPLGPLLHEVREELLDRGVEHAARLHVSDLPVVLGDRDQLKQVFSNLVENAFKYGRPGVEPVVRVESTILVDADDGSCEIVVRDNGRGLDPTEVEHVFEAFHRGSEEGTDGTGIGLAVCLRIVRHHGGSIWAEGEPGVGSAVHVRLCVASTDAGRPDTTTHVP